MRIGVWYRVWIALTGVLLLSAALMAMGKRDLSQLVTRQDARARVTPYNCVPTTVEFREKAVGPPVDSNGVPIPPTLPGVIFPREDPNFVTEASCASTRSLTRHLMAALGIALMLLVGGLALRWIFRGFEKPAQ
jgi:hypothetical protein